MKNKQDLLTLKQAQSLDENLVTSESWGKCGSHCMLMLTDEGSEAVIQMTWRAKVLRGKT